MRILYRQTARIFPPTETLKGYGEPELVEVIFQETKACEPHGRWPEMDGVSSVLDFGAGGGCGLHYKQAPGNGRRISMGRSSKLRAAAFTDAEVIRMFGEVPDDLIDAK